MLVNFSTPRLYNHPQPLTRQHQKKTYSSQHTANFLRFGMGDSTSSRAIAGTGAALRFELIFEVGRGRRRVVSQNAAGKF